MIKCLEINDMAFPIKLEQYEGKEEFVVSYGLQVDANLSYKEATEKLGEAILHALCCEDKIKCFSD